MTSTLRERAAQAARPTPNNPNPAAQPASPQPQPPVDGGQLDDIDLGPAPEDFAQIPVHMAWVRVMNEIQEIRKNQTANIGGQVRFRGVDRTMNAFGAAQRKHGVIVLPTDVEAAYRDTKTSKGTAMRECTVTVTYEIIGPRGDKLTCQSQGESLDTGDKGTAKAMSVALRTLLLQAGMVPTEAPVDPDQQVYERGEAAGRSAVSYRDEVLDPGTSVGRCRQIYTELGQLRKLSELVTNEVGDEEPVGELVKRIGQERGSARPGGVS